jgi:hypothetical protein
MQFKNPANAVALKISQSGRILFEYLMPASGLVARGFIHAARLGTNIEATRLRSSIRVIRAAGAGSWTAGAVSSHV